MGVGGVRKASNLTFVEIQESSPSKENRTFLLHMTINSIDIDTLMFMKVTS